MAPPPPLRESRAKRREPLTPITSDFTQVIPGAGWQARQIHQRARAQRLEELVPPVSQETEIAVHPFHRDITVVSAQNANILLKYLFPCAKGLVFAVHARSREANRNRHEGAHSG